MEMHVIGLKNVLMLLYNYANHKLDGFCRRALFLKTGVSGHYGVKTEAERRAENDKQCYHAQALAASWQGSRYFR